ncbi:MAG: hypothetical protein PHC34_08255 [Candidatus Gastranaerophilales bacterium]|nr:hypothetical protein [Candidatus Gastranaerophilales bacterium]
MNLSPKALLNKPGFANIAQNTMAAVGVETVLKAVGRPTFIYLDKNTNEETKKYSATKEFLYQALCLTIYLSIIPYFKMGGYRAAKKVFKDKELYPKVCKIFKEFDDKAKVEVKEGFLAPLKKSKLSYKKFMNDYNGRKKAFEDIPEEMQKIKGGIEAISIVGSILGLTILAPQISHFILHPIMGTLGFKKKENPQAEVSSQPIEPKKNNINVNV